MKMSTVSKFLAAAIVLGASAHVQAKSCPLTINSNDQMQFDQAELKVAGDCTTVELTLVHTGKLPVAAMGHNWVLTETSVVRSVALAGQAAPTTQYVKPGDERVIAHTDVVGGGGKTTVSFPTSKLTKGGDYTFFCTFPGHWNVMKGKLVFG